MRISPVPVHHHPRGSLVPLLALGVRSFAQTPRRPRRARPRAYACLSRIGLQFTKFCLSSYSVNTALILIFHPREPDDGIHAVFLTAFDEVTGSKAHKTLASENISSARYT